MNPPGFNIKWIKERLAHLEDDVSKRSFLAALDELERDILKFRPLRADMGMEKPLSTNYCVLGIMENDSEPTGFSLSNFYQSRSPDFPQMLSIPELIARLPQTPEHSKETALGKLSSSSFKTAAFMVVFQSESGHATELLWYHPNLTFEEAVSVMRSVSNSGLPDELTN